MKKTKGKYKLPKQNNGAKIKELFSEKSVQKLEKELVRRSKHSPKNWQKSTQNKTKNKTKTQ